MVKISHIKFLLWYSKHIYCDSRSWLHNEQGLEQPVLYLNFKGWYITDCHSLERYLQRNNHLTQEEAAGETVKCTLTYRALWIKNGQRWIQASASRHVPRNTPRIGGSPSKGPYFYVLASVLKTESWTSVKTQCWNLWTSSALLLWITPL